MSYDDAELHVTALSHYAVSLRAVKYLITNVANGTYRDPIQIVILLLALCNYEVVDGDTKGAVMHHLLPCCAILASQDNILDTVDEDCACFIAEQYMYLSNVNRHIGLGPVAANNRKLTAKTVDLSPDPYRAYYRGRYSGCGYTLFEIVPQIASFATRPAMSYPRHLVSDIIEEYNSLEQRILLWEIPSLLNESNGP
ncbi:hypothetical protein BBP40_011825 [Aspergillus hancockii]|nr:hypothetical protein BBP40_011825 [Aspergillus hancockii]